jgi:type I restriction enzyme M protein
MSTGGDSGALPNGGILPNGSATCPSYTKFYLRARDISVQLISMSCLPAFPISRPYPIRLDPTATPATVPPPARTAGDTTAGTPMSEELHARGLTEHGCPLGPYEYYNVGATSIGALKRFKIVPNREYGKASLNKPDGGDQTDPVFTYVVTQVGEALDSTRFESPNDLPEMVRQFKYFRADKPSYVSSSPKCKVWPVDSFARDAHWSVDRWWTTEERAALGIVERKAVVTVSEFAARLEEERKKIEESKRRLLALEEKVPKPDHTEDILLGNRQFFDLFIGERVLRKQYHGKSKGPIPVWSADMDKPFQWDTTSNIKEFDHDCVLWGIDSNLFKFRVIPKGDKFRTTDHCGCIRIIDPNIDASYLRHRLIAFAVASTLDRELRPNLATMRKAVIRFPVAVDKHGKPKTKPAARRENLEDPERVPHLDLKMQREIAAFYDTFDAAKRELAERMRQLAELELEPLMW